MQMFESSSSIQAISTHTMDYPEMKLKFPPGSTVAWIGPGLRDGNWGRIGRVTGYSEVSPALKVAGFDLCHDPSNFKVLTDFKRCKHGAYILGGDCRTCALEKRQAVIDSGQPYFFAQDPVYQDLITATGSKVELTQTSRILKDVEGSDPRPFANQAAAAAYAKAVANLDCVVTHAYYENYLEMESERPVNLEETIQAISKGLGVSPKEKPFRDGTYHSNSWMWHLDKDRTVQLVFWKATEVVGFRMYNKNIEPFY